MQYLYLDRGSWEIQIADEPQMMADVKQEVKVILVWHIRWLIRRRHGQIITTINRLANMSPARAISRPALGDRGSGPGPLFAIPIPIPIATPISR